MNSELSIFINPVKVAVAAAEFIIERSASAIKSKGRFSLVLAGGSTPETSYSFLADMSKDHGLNWSHIYIFWGDERCVPPQHPDSNFLMASKALLDHVPIPRENIFRMQGEVMPDEAAIAYENGIRTFFSIDNNSLGEPLPKFDLILLGFGEDGHTASLFPKDSSLNETKKWVIAVDHTQPPPPTIPRLTLSLPVINAANEILILATGQNKAHILRQTLIDSKEKCLPIQLIQPSSGRLFWFVDQSAASLNK